MICEIAECMNKVAWVAWQRACWPSAVQSRSTPRLPIYLCDNCVQMVNAHVEARKTLALLMAKRQLLALFSAGEN